MTETQPSKLLVWALIASQLGPPLMFSGVAVALPQMGADLGAGATSLGLVETLYLGGSLAFLLPIGRLADASDKRTLYKLGLLAFGLTALLIGAAGSIELVLPLRFVQGVTSALFAVTGTAILADIVPAAQRGRAFGASIGAIYAGLTLGPILAGALTHAWGWRSVFFVGAGIILLGFGIISSLLPSRWRRPVERFDVASTALLVGAVLSLVAGSATLREGALAWALLAGGLGLTAGFVAHQNRLARAGRQPLIDFAWLMGHHALRNALATQALLYVNAFASIFLFSIYLQVSLGHSAERSGQAIATGTVIMAVVAPFAGRLADRFRPQGLTSLGAGAVFVSALLALTLEMGTEIWLVIGVIGLQSLGFALFSSPNVTLIMNSAPAGATSLASALAAKARSVGMVTGMLVTNLLVSLTLGDAPVTEHPFGFIHTMTLAFSVLAAVTGLAFALCLLASRRPRAGIGGR